MRATALLLLALALAACGRAGAGDLAVGGGKSAKEQAWLVGPFARRIDGAVAELRHCPVTAAEDQYLAVTTYAPGHDQCKLLVFEEDGRLAADYRVPAASPFRVHPEVARHEGETFRQLQVPVSDNVIPFTWRRRRMITLTTRDSYAPAAFVLLEAPARDRLEERLVFWNFGHIHFVVVRAPYVAILGMSNRLLKEGEEGYPAFLAVFDLSDLPAAGTARGTSPGAEDDARQPEALYRYYFGFPMDTKGIAHARAWGLGAWVSAHAESGSVHAVTGGGLTYAVELATGAVRPVVSESYRRAFPKRRANDPTLPEVERHVTDLVAAVRVWRAE